MRQQQSKAFRLASSVVPKFKWLPIIGITGLLIVSILIFRDSLFLEHGFPVQGDFNFPLSEFFVERNLHLWNEHGMYFNGVWQLPRWIMLNTISSVVGEQLYVKLGLLLAHFVPAIVGGLVVYHLLYQRNLLDNRTKKEIAFFIAGLAYISAPLITNVVGIKFFGFSFNSEVMIAFPIFMYAVLSTKRMLLSTLLVFACIIVIFGGSPRETIYCLLLVIPSMVVVWLVNRREFMNSFINVGKLLALVIPISAFAWLPITLDSENIRPQYTAEESTLSHNALETLSQHQELANSFRGLQKWWSVVDFSTDNTLLYNAWYLSSWAIPILAFSSLIIISQPALRKLVAILAALSAILLFLVKGVNPPFGEFYSWILLEAQLPFGVNWIFREPSKFYHFFAFSIAFLLVITLLRIISSTKVKRQTVAVIALMICILVLYAWPLYTGNFKGAFHLTELPEEYIAIRKQLSNTEGNILWVPPYQEGGFSWQKVNPAPDPILVLSPNPFFSMQFVQEELWNNIQIGLRQDQDSLLKYLERIGVKYIVLRNDVLSNSVITKETLRKFDSFVSHVGAKEIYNGNYLRAFELPSNVSYIYAYPQIVNNSINLTDLREFNFESQSDYNAWSKLTPQSENYRLTRSGNNLEAKLWKSSPNWKQVNSPLIEIDPDQSYFLESKIKAQNIHQAHLKVMELDANKILVSSQTLEGIGDGTFDWRLIKARYIPSSNLVHYVQFQIWHGYNSDKPLPNEISIEFFRYGMLKFNNEFYQQQALSYKKMDDTKYIVNIPQSQGLHVVVFPQFFDSLWIAKIDGKEYHPSLFSNSVNAFVVDKDGTMEISYKPQQSFYPGVLISVASLGTAVAYSIYEWKTIRMGKSTCKPHQH